MSYTKLITFFLLGVLIGGLIVEYSISRAVHERELPEEISVDETLASSVPTELRIPVVGIQASFEDPLGLDADGGVRVPKSYTTVGWYTHSPTPGTLGPSVVLGHVDSHDGPAVFWDLKKVRVGDKIYIDREDGTTATFLVTKVEHRSQGNFPTEEVYGDIDHAGLRLITCSGYYNHETLRYSHNLIVYAALSDTMAP